MKKLWWTFLFSFPLLLTAQLNESDSLKVKANLALTGFWQSGNVETLIFRAKSEVSIKPWRRWVFKTTNSYIYQEFGKVKADEDMLSLNFLYFNPERRLFPLVLAFGSSNFRREIRVRTLLGAGFTYQILNKKEHWLKFSITSEYEETTFVSDQFNRSDYNGSNFINTFRGTLWINGKYKLFDGKMVLSHESYFQPSLQRGDNFRWRADLGLEFPVWKFFNFKVNYVYSYESIVIESQMQQDQTLTFGVSLQNHGKE
jgi:hypothetical protein